MTGSSPEIISNKAPSGMEGAKKEGDQGITGPSGPASRSGSRSPGKASKPSPEKSIAASNKSSAPGHSRNPSQVQLPIKKVNSKNSKVNSPD